MPVPWRNGRYARRQVGRAPAQQRGVEGHDDRAVAGLLGARHETPRDVVVLGPVELEPARGVAGRLRDLFQRPRRCGAGDEGQPHGRGRARGGELTLGVEDRLHSHRREHHGRRHLGAEHRGAQIPFRHVAQHARDDAPAAERLQVRPHRVARARAAPDEVPGPRVDRLGRAPLQLLPLEGLRRRLSGHSAEVDLVLPVAEVLGNYATSYAAGIDAGRPALVGGPQERPLVRVVAALVHVPVRAARVPDAHREARAQLAVELLRPLARHLDAPRARALERTEGGDHVPHPGFDHVDDRPRAPVRVRPVDEEHVGEAEARSSPGTPVGSPPTPGRACGPPRRRSPSARRSRAS